MKKIILFVSILFAFITSCSKEDVTKNEISSSQVIKFNGTLKSNTKIFGAFWDKGDSICVVMRKTGTLLNQTNVIPNNEGHFLSLYRTDIGDGSFTSIKGSYSYPQNAENVDFVAFHPTGIPPVENVPIRLSYRLDGDIKSTYYLWMQLKYQEDQKKLDLIYSNNIVNKNKDNQGNELEFTRKMSKVEFNITAGEGLTDSDLIGLETYIYGFSDTGYFDLSTGEFTGLDARNGFIEFKGSPNGKFMEATLFPVDMILAMKNMKNEIQPLRVDFKLKAGNIFTWVLPNNITFEEGKRYIYNIEIRKTIKDNKNVIELSKSIIKDWVTVSTESIIVE